jgi:uncharacterized protein YdaU (DUF1376 family)
MARARYALWHIDRWRTSSAFTDMTLEEQGAYRNLIDELWLRGGVLPDDDRVLGRLCGDSSAWARVSHAVMAKFERTKDGWKNADLSTLTVSMASRREL